MIPNYYHHKFSKYFLVNARVLETFSNLIRYVVAIHIVVSIFNIKL